MTHANPQQVTKTFSIVGSIFIPGATDLIKRLRPNQPLVLARERSNPRDSNAVMVICNNRKIGYLPNVAQEDGVRRGLASVIAPLLDAGVKVIAKKANNPIGSVCMLAYIQPEPTNTEEVPHDESNTDAPGRA
jgi:hypothetical protein